MKKYKPVLKESTLVIPDINNGDIVNKIFEQFNKVKNEKQLLDVEKKIIDLKFNVRELIDSWDKGNANSIVRKDFIDFVERVYKKKYYNKWKD